MIERVFPGTAAADDELVGDVVELGEPDRRLDDPADIVHRPGRLAETFPLDRHGPGRLIDLVPAGFGRHRDFLADAVRGSGPIPLPAGQGRRT